MKKKPFKHFAAFLVTKMGKQKFSFSELSSYLQNTLRTSKHTRTLLLIQMLLSLFLRSLGTHLVTKYLIPLS